jgi:hypothetical protein
MKTHKHLHLARRKMGHIIDEIYTALLHYGSREVDLNIMREEKGLYLLVDSNFDSEHLHHIQRMAELLQPEVRSPAMVEMYWELAGEDRYTSDSEMSLVGQMADEAALTVEGQCVEIEIFVAY